MKQRNSNIGRLIGLFAGCIAAGVYAAACGGGGGGGGGESQPTRISGNLVQRTAARAAVHVEKRRVMHRSVLSLIREAHAQLVGVPVCISGTQICTETDETGSFLIEADVAGEVCLDIASGFAEFCLPDVAAGSTIIVVNIDCDEMSQQCFADQVDVSLPPSPESSPDPTPDASPSPTGSPAPSPGASPSPSPDASPSPSVSPSPSPDASPSPSEPSIDEPSVEEPSIEEPSISDPSAPDLPSVSSDSSLS